MSNNALDNLEEFIQNGLTDKLVEAMTKAVLIVEGTAKELCPVDDGQLRTSITHDIEADSNSVTGYVGSNLEYAPYVHQGTGIYAKNGDGRKTDWYYQDVRGEWHHTKGSKPNPFLEKSIKQNKSKIKEQFEDIV